MSADAIQTGVQTGVGAEEGRAILEAKAVSKHYGAVHALRGVSMDLRAGEILGVAGDNAAGKSTLMKILYGAVRPDAGEVHVAGQRVDFTSPRDAQAMGIGMQYQDLALFNNLDVAANIFAGREPVRRIFGIPFIRSAPMYGESEELVKRLNVSISSMRLLVERMSGGQRQMIAAARAIGFQQRVLIMDEPTAALGVRETTTLLNLLSGLREHGLSIILVTHRIPDLLAIGNRILVLKGGASQGVLDVAGSHLDDVVTLIVRGRNDPQPPTSEPR